MSDPGPGPNVLAARILRWARAETFSDAVFRLVTGLFALLVIIIFGYVVVLLAEDAWPAISAFGAKFLISRSWDPPGQQFGALPYVVGTVSSSLLALLVAVPVAIGTAVALTQLLPRVIVSPLGVLIELLAAVPSIVFGVWGLVVVVPFVRGVCGPDSFGKSVLAAGLVLAVMMLPYVTSVARDMLRAVPLHQREAALALGATRWEVTWQILIPHARGGIFAAIVLGLGRAIGETMAVIMVIGNQPLLPKTACDAGATMASVIANEFGDPSGPLHFAALVELGLVLLFVSLLLNVASKLLVRAVTRKTGARA